MSMTRNITTRTLIWLTAILVPVQGLPAAACGCASGKRCDQKVEQSSNCCGASSSDAAATHNCCQSQSTGACRCTGAKVCRCGENSDCKSAESCCGTDACCSNEGGSACSCGTNCQCGSNHMPEKPVAPPVENNTAEKVASDSVLTVSLSTVYEPPAARRTPQTSVETDVLAALDRCAALCRFTL